MPTEDSLSHEERVAIYQEQHDKIELGIRKNSVKWNLKAITWMDYDDASQHIRRHIFKKLHLWEAERKNFSSWVNTVISNQIKNIIRDNYGNFVKPCDRQCPFNTGNGGCSKTSSQVQDSECEAYENWENKKKRAFDVKLPLPMDETLCGESSTFVDYQDSAARLHEKVISLLPERQAEIYKLIYIDGKDDAEIAEIFGYKREKNRSGKIRFKQITNLRKGFLEIAKEVIANNDIV